MADKTVTLSDQDWQQLVAVIANAIGYVPFQKLVSQLQAQDGSKGDGLDHEPPELPLSPRATGRAR